MYATTSNRHRVVIAKVIKDSIRVEIIGIAVGCSTNSKINDK